jgi:hypothetical protein
MGSKENHIVKVMDNFHTCLVLFSCVPTPTLSLLKPLPVVVARCENGAGTVYGLIVCNN